MSVTPTDFSLSMMVDFANYFNKLAVSMCLTSGVMVLVMFHSG